MKTFRSVPKLVPALAALALSFAVAACGDDDDDDTPPTPDAATTDAPAPDAAGPDATASPDAAVSTRAGTLAVTEIAAPQLGVSGGVVSLPFTDITAAGGTIVYDDRNATGVGCSVTVFDFAAGDVPQPNTNEGPVTITGTAQPIAAPCAFNAAAGGYLCIVDGGLGAVGDLFIAGATPILSVAGATFTSDHVGMFISISGAATPANNGSFPIMARISDTQIVVGNPGMASESAEGIQFAIIAGAGPTPANVDFLNSDVSASVTIAKDSTGVDGVEVDDFSKTVGVAGDTYTLDGNSAQVNAFPTDGNAVTFSCSDQPSGGDCSSGVVTALTGSATNADVSGVPIPGMPRGTKLAAFSCAGFSADLTMPQAAVAEILGISPSRIEVRVFRFNLAQFANADGTNKMNLLVGHGFVGWTDPAP